MVYGIFVPCLQAELLQSVNSATLQTIACWAPLSMGFSRQEYWSELLCPPPGTLPTPDGTPISCVSCTGRWILYHYRRLGSPLVPLPGVKPGPLAVKALTTGPPGNSPSPFFLNRYGNPGSERLSYLPMVTQLLRSRVRI